MKNMQKEIFISIMPGDFKGTAFQKNRIVVKNNGPT
jgi:hypothetical protein